MYQAIIDNKEFYTVIEGLPEKTLRERSKVNRRN